MEIEINVFFCRVSLATTYIIPSVLIVVMLVVGIVIAFILSRKSKYLEARMMADSSTKQPLYKSV